MPAGTSSAVNATPIADGDLLVNFQHMNMLGRFFTAAEYTALVQQRTGTRFQNPVNNTVVLPASVRFYRARIVAPPPPAPAYVPPAGFSFAPFPAPPASAAGLPPVDVANDASSSIFFNDLRDHPGQILADWQGQAEQHNNYFTLQEYQMLVAAAKNRPNQLIEDPLNRNWVTPAQVRFIRANILPAVAGAGRPRKTKLPPAVLRLLQSLAH